MTHSLSMCSNYPNSIRKISKKSGNRIQIVSERKTKHLELSHYFWNISKIYFKNFDRVLPSIQELSDTWGLVKISCFLYILFLYLLFFFKLLKHNLKSKMFKNSHILAPFLVGHAVLDPQISITTLSTSWVICDSQGVLRWIVIYSLDFFP